MTYIIQRQVDTKWFDAARHEDKERATKNLSYLRREEERRVKEQRLFRVAYAQRIRLIEVIA